MCVCVFEWETFGLRCICPVPQEMSCYEVCHFPHSFCSACESLHGWWSGLFYFPLTFREVSQRRGEGERWGRLWWVVRWVTHRITLSSKYKRKVNAGDGLIERFVKHMMIKLQSCQEHLCTSSCDSVWTCRDAGIRRLVASVGFTLNTHTQWCNIQDVRFPTRKACMIVHVSCFLWKPVSVTG